MTGVIRSTLAVAALQLAVLWQLLGHPPATSAGALAVVAATLLATLLAVVAHGRLTDCIIAAGPLLRRAVGLRRKSWGAAFQRQRDPDAAGRPRARAPSAAPVAA